MYYHLRCLILICLPNYLTSQPNIVITIAAIILSILLLGHARRSSTSKNIKPYLLIGHVFSLAIPFVFFAFTMNCKMLITECLIKALLFSIPFIMIFSLVIGYFIIPIIIFRLWKTYPITGCSILNFLKKESNMLGIKVPHLYLVDSAMPIAFSYVGYLRGIFLSVGLFDNLTRKELEAVVLHELYHIQKRSSLLKFLAFYTRLFSPIANFSFYLSELNKEEEEADMFVIKRQKTSHHLKYSKNMMAYYSILSK